MSKFADLKQLHEKRQAKTPKPAARGSAKAAATLSASGKKIGRPPGKRSDPEYQQVTVFIHRDTYKKIKMRLLEDEKEVSELTNELYSAWLNG